MAQPDDDVEIGGDRLGLGAVMDGVEGDARKQARQRLVVLLRVVMENENLHRHDDP